MVSKETGTHCLVLKTGNLVTIDIAFQDYLCSILVNLETKESHNSPISAFRVLGCLRSGWGEGTPETRVPNASFQMAIHPVASHPSHQDELSEQPDTREWPVQAGKREDLQPEFLKQSSLIFICQTYQGPAGPSLTLVTPVVGARASAPVGLQVRAGASWQSQEGASWESLTVSLITSQYQHHSSSHTARREF